MHEVVVNTLLIVSALFPIVNPLGGAPIFLSLTRDYTSAERSVLSWRVALNSFLLLIASLLVGTHILSFFGISIPVVQVGGGLVVISTGWKMLNWKSEEDTVNQARKNGSAEDITQQAFYPLTLPVTVGPGSISVAITLGANAPHHAGGNLLVILAAVNGSLLTALSVYLCYASAERMSRLLGAAGMGVVMRLSSFLLLCIGVQIVWNGVSALLRTLLQLAG
jgi:multiple antibiotic resistance protein